MTRATTEVPPYEVKSRPLHADLPHTLRLHPLSLCRVALTRRINTVMAHKVCIILRQRARNYTSLGPYHCRNISADFLASYHGTEKYVYAMNESEKTVTLGGW